MSQPPSPPLVLASTSPQRRAILQQLRIPFDVVAPDFDEAPGTSPLDRAVGKARSVPLGPPESPVPPGHSWFGIGPGVGPAAPAQTFNPVVGSAQRTGLFVHPFTGRTRYSGLGYDSATGRFGTYSFRR